MKKYASLSLFLIFTASLYSQDSQAAPLESYNPDETLSSEKCYDVIKAVWDGLKKISETKSWDSRSVRPSSRRSLICWWWEIEKKRRGRSPQESEVGRQ